jgi:sulfofructose kinase
MPPPGKHRNPHQKFMPGAAFGQARAATAIEAGPDFWPISRAASHAILVAYGQLLIMSTVSFHYKNIIRRASLPAIPAGFSLACEARGRLALENLARYRLMVARMSGGIEIVDVVGVGLNATDTVIRLPHFPAFNSKTRVRSVERQAGGQVASALVACHRWGLRTRYVGSIGDDEAGEFQQRELEREGVEAHWLVVPGGRSQFAYILVDESTGERTILWGRDEALEMRPEQIEREWVERVRLLHVDGHDARAAAQAARWAREAGVPVTADMDNVYPGAEELLGSVDYLLGTAEFPARFLGEADLLKALPLLASRYGCRVAGATMGAQGALAWDGERFHYAPAFLVETVDTTGAGDIFHAGYVYGILAGWEIDACLEFACAAAALNSTRIGARGGIFPVEEILRFARTGRRREAAYAPEALGRAAARNR